MGRVLDLAEKLWTGETSAWEHPPYAPLLEMERITDDVGFVSSFANATAIVTGEGIVLVDVGSAILQEQVFNHVRELSSARVHTAIYTHGHLDHVMGIARFDDEARSRGWPCPHVVAHEKVPARFERYALTAGYNACINTRQFQMKVEWPTEFRAPDETYATERALDVGGVRFELTHARGETDDHTWIFVPSKKLLCTGDLFLWCCPNAGNPQKVQRYPLEWARALRAMSAKNAEILAPGHGVPIVGAARVKQALEDTAALLEHLHDRTVEAMNAGATLDEIVHAVRAPDALLAKPYLHPVYDEPEFIVRNVWRLYGGWWDGDPSHLKPAPAAKLAAEIASLAGGAKALVDRASKLAETGEIALACHLAELAGKAAPGDAAIAEARAAVYRQRAQSERSLMARGIYATAAKAAGRRGDGETS